MKNPVAYATDPQGIVHLKDELLGEALCQTQAPLVLGDETVSGHAATCSGCRRAIDLDRCEALGVHKAPENLAWATRAVVAWVLHLAGTTSTETLCGQVADGSRYDFIARESFPSVCPACALALLRDETEVRS